MECEGEDLVAENDGGEGNRLFATFFAVKNRGPAEGLASTMCFYKGNMIQESIG